MRRHARARFRKPHIHSAYVDTRLCHCATTVCGLSFFALLFTSMYMIGRYIGRPEDRQTIIAAVKKEQAYRFNRIGKPLEFSEWSQHGKLARHCNGSYETYGDSYARLFDVVLRPSRSNGPIGGETVDAVLNRAESEEYLKLSPGFFTMSCPIAERHFKNPFEQKPVRNSITARSKKPPPRNFLAEFHNAIEFVEPTTGLTTGTSRATATATGALSVLNDTVFALTRYEYANFFHTVTYMYNAFLTARALGLSCDEAHVMFVDAHARSSLDVVWHTLFRNVTRIKQLPDGVRARELVWLPLGYSTPLMNEALRQIPLLEEFGAFYLKKHGFSMADRPLDCSNVTVTFLFRRNYVAHPRNPSGAVPRRVHNEAELLAETESTFRAAAPKLRLNLRSVAFESLTMRQQLAHIVQTDILIGMHGAGLTHILFLPKHAGIIEMFTRGTRASHYEAFARWRSLKYKIYQNRDNQNQNSIDISPIAITYLIDTLLTEMQCCVGTCIVPTTSPASVPAA